MKKIIIILFVVPILAFSQKEDYVWRLGYWSGINFNSGQADTFSMSSPREILFTNSSSCDSVGNLLFYTNGSDIFNAANDTMLNGSQLNPCTFTTNHNPIPIPGADIIIKRPGYSNFFYLFHETMDNNSSLLTNVLYLTVVDMTLDSGRGAVTSVKNFHLYDGDTLATGKLSAVRHANGRDWWLLTRKRTPTIFYKWLIQPDTIEGPFPQTGLQGVGPLPEPTFGQSCFSPNGQKYAAIYQNKFLYVYDFDRCTGILTNNFSTLLTDSSLWGTGCAFSHSGRFLYVSTELFIYQYDMFAGNIIASQTVVAVYDNFLSPDPTHFTNMRLAPDGKIYISTDNGTNVLHVIANPDSIGIACNVLQHFIHFTQSNAGIVSVPNIPDYRLGPLNDSGCDTLLSVPKNQKTDFSVSVYPNPTSSSFTLKFFCFKNLPYSLTVRDISGRLLLSIGENAVKGINLKEMDLSELAKGIYFVNLSSSEINETIRVTIE